MSALSEIESVDRGPDVSEAILRELLRGSVCTLEVTGACMEPALLEGTCVSLRSSASRVPRWGDIVLARHPSGMRLHRLVWPFAFPWGGLRTKGDQAHFLDPPLLPVAVLATVVEPREGTIICLGRSFLSLVRAILYRVREKVPRVA